MIAQDEANTQDGWRVPALKVAEKHQDISHVGAPSDIGFTSSSVGNQGCTRRLLHTSCRDFSQWVS